MWGGWGSNPRPADYEEPGPALRARCLHGYHGVAPLVALVAPFAQMARSTNRSTPLRAITGYQLQNVTAADRHRMPRPLGRAARVSGNVANRRASEFDFKHEIIRRVHQERDQAPAVRAEMH
jgi:hypothetical protein